MAKLKLSVIISLMSALLFTYSQGKNEPVNTDNLFVLVKYKAQPEKHDAALSALNTLILEVTKEQNFVNIKLFIDPSDPANILLYEEWTDESYYKGEHMSTPHLQEFMNSAREFLAGPPDISLWKLNNDYRNY